MSEPLPFHGGRISDACARFGGKAEDWLDLSTGINPNAWPPPDFASPDWRALPDPGELARLESTAAAYFGTDPSLCLAVPGSEAGLRAVARILRLPARHLPLTYSTHKQAFAHAEPITGIEGAGRSPSVLVLANPNNPDGALIPREVLLAALEKQERYSGWLIVDEAFVDCAPEWSVADCVTENRRLIVTRSFGKFFGLAGVRLGFVLAPSDVLAQLRQMQGEWPVCAAALSFGTRAYADSDWIARTRAALPAAAAQLDEVLVRHGLARRGGSPLFRLVEASRAAQVFTALANLRILTRPFADHPQLLRFGLPRDVEDLARLDTALGQTDGHG
ncbi:threonine-phosphate decarboxylase [Novosphingobium sp. RD2P27]|uniref:Threonine-phosphate decarboxylase n=1 Tax=Novosphingobium kalidii TaxID=3230299 RepID=A0ABV2CXL1_9SPHN